MVHILFKLHPAFILAIRFKGKEFPGGYEAKGQTKGSRECSSTSTKAIHFRWEFQENSVIKATDYTEVHR